jgi:predicted DNA-binding protein YlxM (UPF0122 family)
MNFKDFTFTKLCEMLNIHKNAKEESIKTVEDIEDEIESRLKKKCEAYDKICGFIKKSLNPPYYDGVSYNEVNAYRDSQKVLREWLIKNPQFLKEMDK